MPKIEEKFSQNRVDIIKRSLEREAKRGVPKDYEIIIDGFKVVSRTDKVEEFDDYELDLNNEARMIEFLIFDGKETNRNTRYSLSMGKDSDQPMNGHGGLGAVDQLIQQRLDEKDKEYEIKQLKEKLEKAEEDLEDAEEYSEQLKTELQFLKDEKEANKFNLGGLNIVEVGSEILKYTLTKNAGKKGLVGQLSGLMGVLSEAGSKQTTEDAIAEDVTKDQPAPQEFSEKQLEAVNFILQLEQAFNPEQMLLLNHIIGSLMNEPKQLVTVAQLLNVQI